MDESDPERWTDAEVHEYLLRECGPVSGWRVYESVYGYVGADGVLMACADDWDERANRIVRYLHQIGTLGMLPNP